MSMHLSLADVWWLIALLGVMIVVLFIPLERRREKKAAGQGGEGIVRGPEHSAGGAGIPGGPTERSIPMKVTDPVCGMTFDEKKAVATVEHQGRTYHFCTEACRKQFEADPDRYANGV